MAALPKSMALIARANNKYLELNHEEGHQYKGFIQFSGDWIANQYTRFELQMAESNPNLVHIRSVSNNKYWSASKQTDPWLAAAAEKPEEDRSKWNCTLFEPRSAGAGLQFRFLHVQLGRFARFMNSPSRFGMVVPLVPSPDSSQSFDVFTLVDWESLVIMPKYVSFKGNNDLFLRGKIVQNLEHLQFEASDGRDPAAAHEVIMTSDGSLRLKSLHFNKFWRPRTGNWILADTTYLTTDTLFWPVKLGENVIALRSLENNNFCSLLTHDRRTDCLNAGTGALSGVTHLEVSELVVFRRIFNTVFHLMDARIYNEQVIVMGTGSAVNTTNHESTLEVKMTLTESRSSTWSTSISLMLGIKTTFVTKVPLIFEGKIETSAEFTVQYEMGRTNTTETSFETTYGVVVPPRTSAVVRALATSATCDVPFSYTQTDLLWNGQQTMTRLHDGVYTGINAYNMHYEPLLTPINMSKLYADPTVVVAAAVDPAPTPAVAVAVDPAPTPAVAVAAAAE